MTRHELTNGPSGPPPRVWAHLACTAALFAVASGSAAPAGDGIVIDGGFEDWRGAPVVVRDAADSTGREIDFGEVLVRSDARFVHLAVHLGGVVNVQRLDGRLDVLLNADADWDTGTARHGMAGVDAVVSFTPPNSDDPARPGMGVGFSTTGPAAPAPRSPYDAGITFAPTFANEKIEIRIERSAEVGAAAPLLSGGRFEACLVYTDASGAVLDRTEIFTVDLPQFAAPTAPADDEQAADPLARTAGCDLRVMSWNVEYGGLVNHGEIARRIVEAIDPDVILVQELTDANTAQEIESLLNGEPGRTGTDGRGRWRAFVGGGGGNLRCAVIARHPLERGGAPEPIDYPNQAGRYLRSASLVVEPNGRRLLVLSAHLKCCGKIGDRSDEKRVVESTAIRDALLAAMDDMRVDGLVVGGDLNLVGGRKPLEILAGGLDLDGSALEIAQPFQLDGRSNATWSDPDQPFVPGRLDYMLVSDRSLELMRSFVLDSRDLAPRWQRHHGVAVDDTGLMSDHFPVVVDLKWREP